MRFGTFAYVDGGEHYEYVDHVALEVDGCFFDASGLITDDVFKEYAGSDVDDQDGAVEIHYAEEEDVLRMVDSSGGGITTPLDGEQLEADLKTAIAEVVKERKSASCKETFSGPA